MWSRSFDSWSDWSTLLRDATGYVLDLTERSDDPTLADDDSWLREQKAAADASGISAPVSYGGGDPHHLSDHIKGPLRPVDRLPLLVRTSAADRRAVLFLDSMTGWYRALATETRSLPKLAGHSWRVDVVVKPVGWLGTYRRSAETGLWFSCPHSVHVRGV